MNRQYTKEEIDVLIFKYKDHNDEQALIEVLAAFDGYIMKYANFLKRGRYSESDKDINNLICMLKQSSKIKTVELIVSIFTKFEYEDIIAQLKMLFLKCIKKFVRRKFGPFFSGYLYGYYKYHVKDWIAKLSQDAMYSLGLDKEELNSEVPRVPIKRMADIYENFCISEKSYLNSAEKYIIYMYYYKKLKEREIGEKLGLTRFYVNMVKKRAVNKLQKLGITLDDFQL